MGAGDFLKKAFPFLATAATAFGGPAGAAGAAILGKVLGKEVKPADIEGELVKLTSTEEGRAKAAQAEQEFQLAMTSLGFRHVEELEKLTVEDRASARQREANVKDKMPMLLGIGTVVVFFTVIMTLMFREPPTVSRDILMILLGVLAGGFKDILGYFFGSSAGSASARETISKIAEKV